MNLSEKLSDFNCRMVEEVNGTFARNVVPYQMDDGTLLFRGPIQGDVDPKYTGTHVAVSLEAAVHAALVDATLGECEEITQALLANLGTQVKLQYHPTTIGPYALAVVGTMRTVIG